MSTIFNAIIKNEIHCDKIFEDDQCIAIHDIRPVAPIHILIIPRKPSPSMAEATLEDSALLGHLLWTAHQLAVTLKLDTGYRVVINTGIDGLQSVNHLHIHLLGGRGFSWPPG